MAPQEYQNFIDNPRDDIPKSTKQVLESSLDTMRNVSSEKIKDWEDAFLLATPGTAADQKIKRIFRNMSPGFDSTFESPDEATKFIRKCYKKLIKELPFEGFDIFDGI